MKFSLSLLFSVRSLPAIGLATAGLLCSVHAAEPVALDQGLTYLRVTSLEQSTSDLHAALLKPAPLVIDVRYPADATGAEDFLREFNTQPRKPVVYILVSPSTPRELAEGLANTHLTLLGIKGSRPEPTVIVTQSAGDDRRAYDALTSGTPLADLISGKVEKERFDEASLVTEFKNGNHDAHPPETAPAGAKAAAPAKLVDRVLQRAAHLNRALLALKPRG